MNWWIIFGFLALASVAVPVWQLIASRLRARLLSKIEVDVKAGKLSQGSLEDSNNGVISVSEDGFIVRHGDNPAAEVEWDEVEEIIAYKTDLLATDLICWGFCCSGEHRMIEVDEHMAGFKELQKAVESRYEVTLQDWFDEVAFPPFAENMTVIWESRKNSQSSRPADRRRTGS